MILLIFMALIIAFIVDEFENATWMPDDYDE